MTTSPLISSSHAERAPGRPSLPCSRSAAQRAQRRTMSPSRAPETKSEPVYTCGPRFEPGPRVRHLYRGGTADGR
eukprot:12776461-Alexandrium_andersonii.AAC.1